MKKLIYLALLLIYAVSCKQDAKDIIVDEIKTPCDFVHNMNLIEIEMISLKDGKDLHTLLKNKNSKNYKAFLNLFILHQELVKESEKKNFTVSSYKSCPEWEEYLENGRKVWENHTSF